MLRLRFSLYISGVCIILFCVNYRFHFFAFNHFNEPRTADFCIMTYNVGNGGFDTKVARQSRKDSLFKIISEIKPDIICFQEYNKWNIRKFERLMARDYPYSVFKGHIYSKYEIKNYGFIDMERRSASIRQMRQEDSLLFKDANIEKVCLYADILIKGKLVRIFNVRLCTNNISRPLKENSSFSDKIHNIKKGYKYGKRMRLLEADLIHKEIQRSPYPVIVCGDFNDIPGSSTLKNITGKNLCDTWWEIGNGLGITYHAHNCYFRIDYILHSSHFEPSEIFTFNSNFSDHYPLIGTFHLQ